MTKLSQTHYLDIPQPSGVSSGLQVQRKEFWPAVSREFGAMTAQAVETGLGMSIRNGMQTQAELTTVALADTIQFCASTYCGANDLPDTVFDEALDFVMIRFGAIGVGEIKEAFRLAASGELGEVDLKAYYGNFTLATLGDVLRKYQTHRAEIIKALQKAEAKQRLTEIEFVKANYWNTPDGLAEIERQDNERINDLRKMQEPDTDKFTVYDYKLLSDKRGLLCLTPDEKHGLVADAKSKLKSWANAIRFKQAHVSQKDRAKNYLNGKYDGEEIVLAQKLAVLNWIQNEQSKINFS